MDQDQEQEQEQRARDRERFKDLCGDVRYRLNYLDAMIGLMQHNAVALLPVERARWTQVLNGLLATIKAEWEAATPDLLEATYRARGFGSSEDGDNF